MRRFTDILVTAIAPLVWGTNYLLTTNILPPDRPLLDSVVRSLPIGLLIILFARKLPKGGWWWKTAVLAALNFGAFFPLLFLAAYHLPGSVASMIGAAQPVFVIGLAWGILAQKPIAQTLAAAASVVIGLALLLGPSVHGLDLTGVGAAFGATALMAIATVLVKKWGSPAEPLVFAGWQLAMGGAMLVPFAFLEGPLPHMNATVIGGYAFLGFIGTALAYACWFHGINKLSPVATSLIGTLNPIIAIGLGLTFNHEHLSPMQVVGIAVTLGAIALGTNAGGVEKRPTSRRFTVHPAPAARLRARAEAARVSVGDSDLLRATR